VIGTTNFGLNCPSREGVSIVENKERITDLEARIKVLEDTEEIKKLMCNYTYYLDYGEVDKVMDCFADHARLEVRARGTEEAGPHVGVFEGKKAIETGVFRVATHFKDRFVEAHQIENPVVTVEGDRAKGTFYLFAPHGRERAVWAHGRYDMEFARIDGKWKISLFKFLWNFNTPYDEGWFKTPMVPDP
jgi:hypothetical protein